MYTEVYDISVQLRKIQLTLEQNKFELCRPTYVDFSQIL